MPAHTIPAPRPPRIAPSLLSADFAHLEREIAEVLAGGADLLHLDVMDGHFVPNLTFGPLVVRSIRGVTDALLDCHLMVTDPAAWVEPFLQAGADWITIHVEAGGNTGQVLRAIRKGGARPGIALNPDTPLQLLEPILDDADLVLVMSVVPGFGGQAFRADVLEKVELLRQRGYPGEISIDGGIAPETASLAVEAGVDVLVAGTAIFGEADRAAAIAALRKARAA